MCPPMPTAWDYIHPLLLLTALTAGLIAAMHIVAALVACFMCNRVRLRVSFWKLSLPFAVAALAALQLVAQVAQMTPNVDELPAPMATVK